MNAFEIYPQTDFLKASELKTARHAKISGYRVVEFTDQATQEVTRKLALKFANTERELVLNKTQAKALATLADSPDTDAWIGLRIALTPSLAPNGQPTIVIGAPATEGTL